MVKRVDLGDEMSIENHSNGILTGIIQQMYPKSLHLSDLGYTIFLRTGANVSNSYYYLLTGIHLHRYDTFICIYFPIILPDRDTFFLFRLNFLYLFHDIFPGMDTFSLFQPDFLYPFHEFFLNMDTLI